MHENENRIVNPAEQLLCLYHKVMDNPCFDQYEMYSSNIIKLFEEIKCVHLSNADLEILSEVRIIHEKIIHVILEEKENLNEEIDLLERKKRAFSHYGNSSNYNADAFFVDFKK